MECCVCVYIGKNIISLCVPLHVCLCLLILLSFLFHDCCPGVWVQDLQVRTWVGGRGFLLSREGLLQIS